MQSPYLHAYFRLIDRYNWKKFFELKEPNIDPFDYLSLMFRFLSRADLIERLEATIRQGI